VSGAGKGGPGRGARSLEGGRGCCGNGGMWGGVVGVRSAARRTSRPLPSCGPFILLLLVAFCCGASFTLAILLHEPCNSARRLRRASKQRMEERRRRRMELREQYQQTGPPVPQVPLPPGSSKLPLVVSLEVRPDESVALKVYIKSKYRTKAQPKYKSSLRAAAGAAAGQTGEVVGAGTGAGAGGAPEGLSVGASLPEAPASMEESQG
jgi:hypothetical protein